MEIATQVLFFIILKPLHNSHMIFKLFKLQGNELRILLRCKNDSVEVTYIFLQILETRNT